MRRERRIGSSIAPGTLVGQYRPRKVFVGNGGSWAGRLMFLMDTRGKPAYDQRK
jgi:hypothetical protein